MTKALIYLAEAIKISKPMRRRVGLRHHEDLSFKGRSNLPHDERDFSY